MLQGGDVLYKQQWELDEGNETKMEIQVFPHTHTQNMFVCKSIFLLYFFIED